MIQVLELQETNRANPPKQTKKGKQKPSSIKKDVNMESDIRRHVWLMYFLITHIT